MYGIEKYEADARAAEAKRHAKEKAGLVSRLTETTYELLVASMKLQRIKRAYEEVRESGDETSMAWKSEAPEWGALIREAGDARQALLDVLAEEFDQ